MQEYTREGYCALLRPRVFANLQTAAPLSVQAELDPNVTHCPHAMALSGGAVCGTKCGAYCDRVMSNCKGSSAIFSSMDVCMAACAAYPEGTLSDTSANTLECRAYHALLARTDANAHCPHASTDGGGVCGTDKCDAYCDQMKANCGTEFSSASGFDLAACKAACATYPDEPSRLTSGNSVQCRTCESWTAFAPVTLRIAALTVTHLRNRLLPLSVTHHRPCDAGEHRQARQRHDSLSARRTIRWWRLRHGMRSVLRHVYEQL